MHIVTGGAGFIGSNIVAELDAAGADIVIVDMLGTDDVKWRNIAKRRLLDIIHPEELSAFLAGRRNVESVVHMGAVSTTTECDVDLIIRSNFKLSVRLWDWCSEVGVPLVYASSAATYGDGRAGFLDDFDPVQLGNLRPLNPYGWSKHLFDRWVCSNLLAHRKQPPKWAGLKFFNVYGPNEYHKGGQRSVAVQLHEQVLQAGCVRLFKSDNPNYADGGQTRDFVWVDDCVSVIRWHLDSDGVRSSVFNVGSGVARSFDDMAKIVFSVLGRPARIEYIDLPEQLAGKYQYYTQASLDKLRDAGYTKPATSLEDGLAKYIENYLNNDDIFR